MDSRQKRKQDATQRRLTRRLLLAAALAAVAMALFELWLRHLSLHADPERALRAVAAASLLINLAIALLAAVLGRFLIGWSRQTREQGQWPPAGLEWPGNRAPRYGDPARSIALRLRIAGITLLLGSFVLAGAMAWRSIN